MPNIDGAISQSLQCLFETEERRIKTFETRMNELIEEGHYPQKLSMPLSVQLELTGKCNLECMHCYNRSGRKYTADTLKCSDWIKIGRDIVAQGGVFQVVISGGEPLVLKEDLFRIMDVFAEDQTRFVFITNGFLVNDKIIRRLGHYKYAWMQVSIDGLTPNIHDSFRGRKGSWHRAVAASVAISNAGIPLKIACSLPPTEIDNVDQYVEQAYRLGASAVILGDIMPSGRALDNEHLAMTPQVKEKLLDRICKARARFKEKIDVQTSSFMKLQLRQATSGPIDSVIIRPNGDVRLDCIAPFVVGNVTATSFCDIWKSLPGDIWKHPLVNRYIDSVSNYTGTSSMIQNHLDADISLQ